jgi:hypothetical protein
MTHAVEVIVPVHDERRPTQRAVSSLLRSGLDDSQLRVTVVCHNVDVNAIRATLDGAVGSRVRLVELHDGLTTPAAPFNFGIENSRADYVSIMGSDDLLEDGALAAWLDLARRHRLSAVIPAERHDTGAKVRTPPVRWRRVAGLDPLRDRLAYRTAPLGLLKRETLGALGLRFPTHLRNGSDQLFGLKLWFSGERIGYGRGLPSYVVGNDAPSRVTFQATPPEQDFAAITELVEDSWFTAQDAGVRRAIIVKTVRIHVFSGVLVRLREERWTERDAEYLAALLARYRESAPAWERSLSIADRRLIDAISSGSAAVSTLRRLSTERTEFRRPAAILTRHPAGILARDGAPRFMIASRLL